MGFGPVGVSIVPDDRPRGMTESAVYATGGGYLALSCRECDWVWNEPDHVVELSDLTKIAEEHQATHPVEMIG